MLRRLVPVLASLAVALTWTPDAGALDGRGVFEPPPRVVEDATGKFMGYLLDAQYYAAVPPATGFVGHVELHVGSAAGVLALTKDRFFNIRYLGSSQFVYVVYDGAACTGTAYLFILPPLGYNGLLPLAGVGLGNTFYVQGATTQFVNVLSRWDDQTGACAGGFGPQTVAPATLLGDLDTLFTPPFQLR